MNLRFLLPSISIGENDHCVNPHWGWVYPSVVFPAAIPQAITEGNSHHPTLLA